MTPQVDLMQVLLVIFIITAPLMTHSTVAETMSADRRAGLTRIGFLTCPGSGEPQDERPP